MDNLVKSINNNRFIIEDSIPKVTSDGEPHEVMTIVAVLSGLIAAVIVLIVLVMLIGCRHNPNSSQPQTNNESNIDKKQTKTIIPIFGKKKSIDTSPQLMSISAISNGIDNYTFLNENNLSNDLNDTVMTTLSLTGVTTVKC